MQLAFPIHNKFKCFALVLFLLAFPVGAMAEEESQLNDDSQEKLLLERVAVMVVRAGDAEVQLADSLTEIMIAGVSQQAAFEILGKEEFQSILGIRSEERTLSCLHDTMCLSRAGAELGISQVLVGNVSLRDNIYTLTFNRVNLVTSKVESHLFFQVAEEEADTLPGLVIEASERLFLPQEEEVAPAGEIPGEGTIQAEQPTAPPSKPIPFLTIGKWGCSALSAGLLLGGVVSGLSVNTKMDELYEAQGDSGVYTFSRARALTLSDEMESSAKRANVLYLTGGLMAAGAAILFYLDSADGQPMPQDELSGANGQNPHPGVTLSFQPMLNGASLRLGF